MWSLVILVSPLPQQVMQTVLITEGHSKTPMSAEWKFMCATNIHGVSDMCQVPAWVLNAQQRTNPMKALVSCQWGRQTSKSTQINVWDVAGGGKCSESKYSRIKPRVTAEGSTQWHYSLLDEGGQLPAKAEWNGQRAMQTTRGCRGWSSWPCISQASQGPHPFVTSMLLLLPEEEASMSPCIWACHWSEQVILAALPSFTLLEAWDHHDAKKSKLASWRPRYPSSWTHQWGHQGPSEDCSCVDDPRWEEQKNCSGATPPKHRKI